LIARAAISLAKGVYDPLLFVESRVEHAADNGGFDPADFSRDAIYDADSVVAKAGLSGLIPGGLTYTLSADFANSEGTRNFLNFESHKVTAGVLLRQPLLRNFWTDASRLAIRVSRHNHTLSGWACAA
jgi:hypothetical protein